MTICGGILAVPGWCISRAVLAIAAVLAFPFMTIADQASRRREHWANWANELITPEEFGQRMYRAPAEEEWRD